MSRRAVNAVLITHLLIVWGAFVMRVDLFPLTWAPMYTVIEHRGTVDVPEWDRTKTLRALRRDGQVEQISQADLNIPLLSYWRLYYERAFHRAPNVHQHANAPMETWCYMVRGIPEGQPLYQRDWARRVLTSVNATLGRREAAPDFIVSMEAHATVAHFAQGDPDAWSTTEEVSRLVWNESWSEGKTRP
jgi:hypothetical protein